MKHPGFYTVRELHELLKTSRQRISHTIDAIHLPVYLGDRGSRLIKVSDLPTLQAALERQPVAATVSA